MEWHVLRIQMFTNTLWLFNLIYDKNNLVCSSLWRSYKIIRLRFCNFYIPFFRTLTHKITTSTYNMYIDGCHLWKKRVSLLMASGHAIFSILIVTTVLYTCPFDLFNSPLQGGLLQIEFISMFIEPTFSWPGLYFQRFIFLLQALISLPIIWVFSICGLHELVRERQGSWSYFFISSGFRKQLYSQITVSPNVRPVSPWYTCLQSDSGIE